MYPGDQWKMREIYGGGAKVKFCQTKMETWSCEYGFILLVHLWHFYVGKGVIYLEIMLER